MEGLTEIDRLEAPLREAHTNKRIAFQDFVYWLRATPTHPLHATAVAYNKAVYEMQKKF